MNGKLTIYTSVRYVDFAGNTRVKFFPIFKDTHLSLENAQECVELFRRANPDLDTSRAEWVPNKQYL
jgi:hypothetical protein